ncbi:hypothetical protein NBRC111894_2495 [Sporolactobacillus inulinus]|uniref:Uncharacterized protein n=1 Tax=Sporolactobacillus inulinus TaxID=2078 RepID=A0A4Y1ZDB4_9BACL|nr:hypothetical protein NBRC111894_2495 [Sporolactobacillus inulinus]
MDMINVILPAKKQQTATRALVHPMIHFVTWLTLNMLQNDTCCQPTRVTA